MERRAFLSAAVVAPLSAALPTVSPMGDSPLVSTTVDAPIAPNPVTFYYASYGGIGNGYIWVSSIKGTRKAARDFHSRDAGSVKAIRFRPLKTPARFIVIDATWEPEHPDFDDDFDIKAYLNHTDAYSDRMRALKPPTSLLSVPPGAKVCTTRDHRQLITLPEAIDQVVEANAKAERRHGSEWLIVFEVGRRAYREIEIDVEDNGVGSIEFLSSYPLRAVRFDAETLAKYPLPPMTTVFTPAEGGAQ